MTNSCRGLRSYQKFRSAFFTTTLLCLAQKAAGIFRMCVAGSLDWLRIALANFANLTRPLGNFRWHISLDTGARAPALHWRFGKTDFQSEWSLHPQAAHPEWPGMSAPPLGTQSDESCLRWDALVIEKKEHVRSRWSNMFISRRNETQNAPLRLRDL